MEILENRTDELRDQVGGSWTPDLAKETRRIEAAYATLDPVFFSFQVRGGTGGHWGARGCDTCVLDMAVPVQPAAR